MLTLIDWILDQFINELMNGSRHVHSVPGGVDLPELVEAEPLRLLHARRQGAQEVLGRHHHLAVT